MMQNEPRLTPGHCLPCRHCVHQADPFLPLACYRARWEGAKNVKPDLQRTEAGVVCGDYQAVWHPTAPIPPIVEVVAEKGTKLEGAIG